MGLLDKLFGSNTKTNTKNTTKSNAATQYNPSTHNNMVQATNKYFEGKEQIDAIWSAISNTKDFNGEKATKLEQLCFNNLKDLDAMCKASKMANFDDAIPPHVPAYVRLAMLYEKQERYNDAIDICAKAIKAGAYRDGSKGTMKGRLARMIKKSNIEVPKDIIKLLD